MIVMFGDLNYQTPLHLSRSEMFGKRTYLRSQSPKSIVRGLVVTCDVWGPQIFDVPETKIHRTCLAVTCDVWGPQIFEVPEAEIHRTCLVVTCDAWGPQIFEVPERAD